MILFLFWVSLCIFLECALFGRVFDLVINNRFLKYLIIRIFIDRMNAKQEVRDSNQSAKGLKQIDDEPEFRKNYKQKSNRNYLFFLVLCIIIQGVAIGIACSKIQSNRVIINNQFIAGDIFLVIGLSVFAMLGLGLINLYETNGQLSGLSGTLLVFALTLQSYLVFSFIWKLIFWSQCSGQNIFSLSVIDTSKRTYLEYSTSDQIFPQCKISLVKALISTESIVDRFNVLTLTALSMIGTIFYCLQVQIISQMSRFDFFDIGFGFSIFTFAASLCTLATRINAAELYKQLQSRKQIYYSTRAIGLISLSILFSTFPFLYASSFYRYSESIYGLNELTIYIVFFNIVFGLISGILGCIAISTIIHGKIHVHLFVCSALSGGVAMSFSSHLHRNLAIPLGVGFVTGAIQTGINEWKNRQILKQSPNFTVLSVHRFLMPSIIGGIVLSLASIDVPIQMSPQGVINDIQAKGGYKFAQLLISLSFGAIAGVLVGVVINLTSIQRQKRQQYIFEHEGKDEEIKLK